MKPITRATTLAELRALVDEARRRCPDPDAIPPALIRSARQSLEAEGIPFDEAAFVRAVRTGTTWRKP